MYLSIHRQNTEGLNTTIVKSIYFREGSILITTIVGQSFSLSVTDW